MNDIVTAERIAVLENKVEELIKSDERINSKLDQLLSLKDRGAGAFWLFGIIFGSGVIAAATAIVSWFKGG